MIQSVMGIFVDFIYNNLLDNHNRIMVMAERFRP